MVDRDLMAAIADKHLGNLQLWRAGNQARRTDAPALVPAGRHRFSKPPRIRHHAKEWHLNIRRTACARPKIFHFPK